MLAQMPPPEVVDSKSVPHELSPDSVITILWLVLGVVSVTLILVLLTRKRKDPS